MLEDVWGGLVKERGKGGEGERRTTRKRKGGAERVRRQREGGRGEKGVSKRRGGLGGRGKGYLVNCGEWGRRRERGLDKEEREERWGRERDRREGGQGTRRRGGSEGGAERGEGVIHQL